MADLEQKQGEAEGQGKEMFSIERSEFDRLQVCLCVCVCVCISVCSSAVAVRSSTG